MATWTLDDGNARLVDLVLESGLRQALLDCGFTTRTARSRHFVRENEEVHWFVHLGTGLKDERGNFNDAIGFRAPEVRRICLEAGFEDPEAQISRTRHNAMIYQPYFGIESFVDEALRADFERQEQASYWPKWFRREFLDSRPRTLNDLSPFWEGRRELWTCREVPKEPNELAWHESLFRKEPDYQNLRHFEPDEIGKVLVHLWQQFCWPEIRQNLTYKGLAGSIYQPKWRGRVTGEDHIAAIVQCLAGNVKRAKAIIGRNLETCDTTEEELLAQEVEDERRKRGTFGLHSETLGPIDETPEELAVARYKNALGKAEKFRRLLRSLKLSDWDIGQTTKF